MKISQVQCFCEVAQQGTLARASERLFIAPTAISMQIAQLEGQLGGELFDRSVKPMSLTSLGRFFLPRARELVALNQSLEQETRDVAKGRSGWLSIGFVRSLIYSVVPAAVQAFRRTHPDVKIDLVELLSENQPAQLRNDRIQIGLSRLTELETPSSDLTHTLLFEDRFVVAVPMDHPLALQEVAALSDLADLPLISFPRDPTSGYAVHVQSILREQGCIPRTGPEAIEIHTALGLVAAGLGYSIVGASVAQRGPIDVKYLPLPELTSVSRILAVSRSGDQGPLVTSMLSALTSLQLRASPVITARESPRTGAPRKTRAPGRATKA